MGRVALVASLRGGSPTRQSYQNIIKMKHLDLEQLKKYIEEEKWGHMKELLGDFLEQPLSDADRGEIATKIGMLFLDLETKQLEQTNASLQDTLNVLRSVNAAERELIAGT